MEDLRDRRYHDGELNLSCNRLYVMVRNLRRVHGLTNAEILTLVNESLEVLNNG
jgi:hypothetical protein